MVFHLRIDSFMATNCIQFTHWVRTRNFLVNCMSDIAREFPFIWWIKEMHCVYAQKCPFFSIQAQSLSVKFHWIHFNMIHINIFDCSVSGSWAQFYFNWIYISITNRLLCQQWNVIRLEQPNRSMLIPFQIMSCSNRFAIYDLNVQSKHFHFDWDRVYRFVFGFFLTSISDFVVVVVFVSVNSEHVQLRGKKNPTTSHAFIARTGGRMDANRKARHTVLW